MPQSAFRNLVNTQYKQEVQVPSLKKKGAFTTQFKYVAKAYLTYEEVIAQIKRDLCSEEVDILIAYLVSHNFPTREQQIVQRQAAEARRAKKAKAKMMKEPKVTVQDIIAANHIEPRGKPVFWNGQDPSQVTGKKKLRVVK